mmetsp:Transcript_16572/g.50168  ORF Transcript_16572/g.50168 Transcript_16572/m.50168 type:complete len:207 (-) Transcript_16572:60-680(-)
MSSSSLDSSDEDDSSPAKMSVRSRRACLSFFFSSRRGDDGRSSSSSVVGCLVTTQSRTSKRKRRSGAAWKWPSWEPKSEILARATSKARSARRQSAERKNCRVAFSDVRFARQHSSAKSSKTCAARAYCFLARASCLAAVSRHSSRRLARRGWSRRTAAESKSAAARYVPERSSALPRRSWRRATRTAYSPAKSQVSASQNRSMAR